MRTISLFYLAMMVVGLALTLWRQSAWQFPEPLTPFQFPGQRPESHLVATIGLVALIHIVSRLWLNRSARARRCADMAIRALGTRRRGDLFWLALLSGLGEEMLFRGWLLHETGPWISSLIFGLIHVPPNRDWWYWPFFATAMGLAFAALTLSSGTVLWAILAHAAINYLNLSHALTHVIAGRQPTPSD